MAIIIHFLFIFQMEMYQKFIFVQSFCAQLLSNTSIYLEDYVVDVKFNF